MLHGCTQSPDDFAAGTEMNAYAERNRFFVVYPEQPVSANLSKCWNWFDSSNQSRGRGEPASIVGVVNKIKSNYPVDSRRVYVAGLSAGGAMSVILGAAYPDVFAAIGVGSGLEYKAATSVLYSGTAMLYGGPDPVQQGNLAYQAMGDMRASCQPLFFTGQPTTRLIPSMEIRLSPNGRKPMIGPATEWITTTLMIRRMSLHTGPCQTGELIQTPFTRIRTERL